jgi:hypothetical protein
MLRVFVAIGDQGVLVDVAFKNCELFGGIRLPGVGEPLQPLGAQAYLVVRGLVRGDQLEDGMDGAPRELLETIQRVQREYTFLQSAKFRGAKTNHSLPLVLCHTYSCGL